MALPKALDWSRRITGYAFWGLASAIVLKDHVVDVTPINGASMNPSLSRNVHETGQRDLVAWRMWQPTKDLERGDLVLFACPSNPDLSVVKRVVATGGDVVTLDPKRRPGQGNPLDELRPEDLAAAQRWNSWRGKLTVPFGHVWVEGDNWRVTRDSNDYGPISKSLIIGKAWMAVWPPRISLTKPWEAYTSKTQVKHGSEVVPEFWSD